MKYVDADDPGEGGFCFPGDPQPYTPDFDDLVFTEALVPSDEYGWLGYEEQGDWVFPLSPLNWLICPFIDFIDGPEIEDITQPGRYMTRWRIIYDRIIREFRYGIVGQAQHAPDPALGITPITLPTAGAQISLGFDADARACFAYQLDATQIRLSRFVSGVPTNYTWFGVNPRLFFDGILQRDLAMTDLVCVYVNVAGDICIRMQRDNFAIEYIQITPSGAPARRVTKVDRFSSYLYTYYTDTLNIRHLARSQVYPPFPIAEDDLATLSVSPEGGSYDETVIMGGNYIENLGIAGAPSGGSYDVSSSIITSGPYVEQAFLTVSPTGGTYDLVVVAGGSYMDLATLTVSPNAGDYFLASVNGGTYVEQAGLTVAPDGGLYS